MSADELRQRIVRKDWSILDSPRPIARGDGDDLVERIRPLAAHPDAEVRELTLAMLDQVRGPAARRAFLAALRDPDESIRARACGFLRGACDAADRPALEEELRQNPDEYVREHAALILGEIGEPAAALALHDRKRVETDAHASWSMTLALARLRDDEAIGAVERALQQHRPSQRAEALGDFQYVGDPRLVPAVIQLLADDRDAVNVGPSHAPWYIRVCDVAVDALDSVLDHPFPFEVEPTRRYMPPELQAAAGAANEHAASARPALERT